jgi:hypothetical protein
MDSASTSTFTPASHDSYSRVVVSRVVMLCSESLLPMVLLSATLMIASATKSPNASLM